MHNAMTAYENRHVTLPGRQLSSNGCQCTHSSCPGKEDSVLAQWLDKRRLVFGMQLQNVVSAAHVPHDAIWRSADCNPKQASTVEVPAVGTGLIGLRHAK